MHSAKRTRIGVSRLLSKVCKTKIRNNLTYSIPYAVINIGLRLDAKCSNNGMEETHHSNESRRFATLVSPSPSNPKIGRDVSVWMLARGFVR
jgi:hypothetical protein